MRGGGLVGYGKENQRDKGRNVSGMRGGGLVG